MNGGAPERAWAAHCIDRFDGGGAALNDRDAARLLVAIEDLKARDNA